MVHTTYRLLLSACLTCLRVSGRLCNTTMQYYYMGTCNFTQWWHAIHKHRPVKHVYANGYEVWFLSNCTYMYQATSNKQLFILEIAKK